VASILYQRNPIYFDPAWVQRLSAANGVDARFRRALAFREMKRSDAVVTPTAAMAGYLRAWETGLRTRLVVIPHAVDAKRFRYCPRPLSLDGRVSLLVVGHPAPHKGAETAIGVVALLRKRGVDASLSLTMNRDVPRIFRRYVDNLVILAKRLAVVDAVRFLGPVDRVESLYHEHDLLIFPSYTESFGFPLLEAMASGQPIVATSIPTTVELLGRDGSYFAPGDVRGAAGQILQLGAMCADEARSRLHALRRSAEERNWASNASRAAALVEECVAWREMNSGSRRGPGERDR